jgi:hypothetical protein
VVGLVGEEPMLPLELGLELELPPVVPEEPAPGVALLPLPIEPLEPAEPLEVPPALLEDEPSLCRQRSFSRPVSASHLADPAPLEDEPAAPALPPLEDGEVVLDGELVLLPLLPLELPEVCANADIAKSAAAVAETMSLRFICAPSGG